MPSYTTDVLICGSGSAGLCAATWLARCGVRCKILESSPGPLQIGKADGVQCRTVEVFESFGLSDDLLRESYHVNEVTFWTATDGGIVRTARTPDTPPGLSHMPHVILNQARINRMLIESMKKCNNQDIDYGWKVTGVHVESAAEDDMEVHPVTVTAEKDGVMQTIRARYVLVSKRRSLLDPPR
jgi:phenol 2-monooxygenase